MGKTRGYWGEAARTTSYLSRCTKLWSSSPALKEKKKEEKGVNVLMSQVPQQVSPPPFHGEPKEPAGASSKQWMEGEFLLFLHGDHHGLHQQLGNLGCELTLQFPDHGARVHKERIGNLGLWLTGYHTGGTGGTGGRVPRSEC